MTRRYGENPGTPFSNCSVLKEIMSPRVIQIPLSGRDRRHYVRELKAAEKTHASLVKRVPEAQAVADEYQLMADRLACEEWSVRQFIGGDSSPSPSIETAVSCGYTLLDIHCSHCTHASTINLSEVIWPKRKGVHTMRYALACKRCSDQERKSRPNLIALRPNDSDGPNTKRLSRNR